VIVVAASIGIILLVAILSPFFTGPGGLLQAASSINSPETLESLKQAILQRYVEDETSFTQGGLSNLAWDKRRSFLVNRYIDAARRLDFVRAVESAEKAEAVSAEGSAP
jgi:hypothetical protein